jgi:hypothetical protein
VSVWTHAICRECYAKEEPGREPIRVLEEDQEPDDCCFCGAVTVEGIFYRADPLRTQCAGVHHDD